MTPLPRYQARGHALHARLTLIQRRRGAVFVEACIVCALLIVMLASGIFFHRLYSAKIRAIRESRLAVWKPAEDGCASALGIGQVFNLVTVDTCVDSSCDVGGLGVDSDQSPDWLGLGAVTSNKAFPVTAHAKAGGGTYSMNANQRIICNEQRQNQYGDLASIGEYIFDAVIP